MLALEKAQAAAAESTFGPVIWLMSGRAVGQVAAFLIPVVLARILDQATFGDYKRLFLLYGTAYGIAQLGFAESLYYFLPRNPGSAGRLATNAMLGLAVSGLGCLLLLVAARERIAGWLGDPALASDLPALGLFLLLMLCSAVLEIALVARKGYALASFAYSASDLLRAAFLVLATLATASLGGLLAGAVAFAALRLLATLFCLRRVLPDGLRPDLTLLRAQCGYALPFSLSVLVETLQGNLHQYVVSARFDAASFAIFSVALLQIPLVDYTATAASSVVMVRMGDALHAGRPGEVKALWHDVVSKLALVFVPLVALLLVTGDELIVLLFTDRYAASVPLFKLASLGILLSMLQTDSVLRTLAQTRLLLELSLVRLGLIAIAIVPALTRFGFAGAIGVTLVSGFTVKTLALVSIGRRQQIPFGDLLPWRSLGLMAILSAAAGLCAFVMRAAIAGPLVLRLLATGAVFAGVYLVLACWSGLVPPAAVRGIRGWLRGAASMN